MKKTLINLCIILSIVACKTEPIEEMAINKRNSSMIIEENEELPPILDYTSDSVDLYNLVLEYVDRNHAILGQNVMVFQTYNQLYETIDLIQELAPDQLREWTIDNNWTNDILESNILLDSVLFSEFANRGIDLDECEDSAYIAATIDAFDNAYDMRPDYFLTTTRDNDEFLEPLGKIDEVVFYNDKNLFIVEGFVHISYGEEGVVICPLDLFVNTGVTAFDATTMYQILTSNASEDQLPFVMFRNTSNMKNYYAKTSSGFYSYISFKTYEKKIILLPRIGKRLAIVEVENWCYNKNKRKYVGVRTRTMLDLTITSTFGNENHTFTFDKNKKFKTKKFSKYYYDTLWGGPVTISSFDLHLNTGTGVVIDKRE